MAPTIARVSLRNVDGQKAPRQERGLSVGDPSPSLQSRGADLGRLAKRGLVFEGSIVMSLRIGLGDLLLPEPRDLAYPDNRHESAIRDASEGL